MVAIWTAASARDSIGLDQSLPDDLRNEARQSPLILYEATP